MPLFNDGDRVIGATVALPGVVIIGSGTTITMVKAANGNTLFTYKDTHIGSKFWGGAAIGEGMIFQGNRDGYLFAFAPSS